MEWRVETSAGTGNPWTPVNAKTFDARSLALLLADDLKRSLPPEADRIRYRARGILLDDDPPGGSLGLRALIKWRGAQEVVDVMGTTTRALIDLRGGYTALTVDDMYALQNAYPSFDLATTIDRLGAKRIRSRRARRLRGV